MFYAHKSRFELEGSVSIGVMLQFLRLLTYELFAVRVFDNC